MALQFHKYYSMKDASRSMGLLIHYFNHPAPHCTNESLALAQHFCEYFRILPPKRNRNRNPPLRHATITMTTARGFAKCWFSIAKIVWYRSARVRRTTFSLWRCRNTDGLWRGLGEEKRFRFLWQLLFRIETLCFSLPLFTTSTTRDLLEVGESLYTPPTTANIEDTKSCTGKLLTGEENEYFIELHSRGAGRERGESIKYPFAICSMRAFAKSLSRGWDWQRNSLTEE